MKTFRNKDENKGRLEEYLNSPPGYEWSHIFSKHDYCAGSLLCKRFELYNDNSKQMINSSVRVSKKNYYSYGN